MSDLEKLLEDYAPGRPEMKPDVIAQTLQLEKDRAKMAEAAAAAGGGGKIVLQQAGQPPIELNNQQVVQILQNLQVEVDSQKKEIERLTCENEALRQKCADAYAAADAAADAAANTETIYV
jgi:septal ring factor EnvC (AmiA/AmiB activator)